MSMITEQINRLRKAADFRHTIGDYMTAGLHIEAAETIEALSERVRAANMERSTAYYNGGWIPVKERLPEKNDYKSCHEVYDGAVLWTNEDGLVGMGYYYESTKRWSDINDCSISVIAWMPLPEPYREDGAV